MILPPPFPQSTVGLYPIAVHPPIVHHGPGKEEAEGTRDETTVRYGKERHMLGTLAVVLLVLWALGLVSNYTMGGFIHILLVLAIVTVLVRIIQGRRVT